MRNPEDLPSGTIPRWTLGDRLRKAREYAGVSREELADDLDVTPRTISNYETDHSRPRRPVIRLYAMRCGVSFDWLVGDAFHPEGDNLRVTMRYPAGLGVAA